jgi:hypothetical protein
MIDIFPIVFLLVSLFLIFDYLSLEKKYKKYFFYILTVFLVIFVGLRGNIDNDFDNYVRIFEVSRNQKFSTVLQTSTYLDFYTEIGYRVLNYLGAIFSSNYSVIFLFTAILSIGLSSFVIFKLSPFPFLSMLLYFSHNLLLRDMMQIRSGVACSLCLLAVYFLSNKNKIKSYSSIFLGFTFHTVAIVFLAMPILSKMEVLKKRKFLFAILTFAILIALTFPFGQIFKIVSFGNGFEKLSGYANNSYFIALSFWNPVNLKQILICVVCILHYKFLKEKFEVFSYLFISYFIGAVWWLFFMDFAIVAGRVSTVFTSVEIILVAIIIKHFSSQKIWLKTTFFFLIFCYSIVDFYINIYGRDYFKAYLIF